MEYLLFRKRKKKATFPMDLKKGDGQMGRNDLTANG